MCEASSSRQFQGFPMLRLVEMNTRRCPPRGGRVTGYFLKCCRLRGNGSLQNVAFGPMNTSSSIRRPSQIWTPHFIVTLSPITTSFSINV